MAGNGLVHRDTSRRPVDMLAGKQARLYVLPVDAATAESTGTRIVYGPIESARYWTLDVITAMESGVGSASTSGHRRPSRRRAGGHLAGIGRQRSGRPRLADEHSTHSAGNGRIHPGRGPAEAEVAFLAFGRVRKGG